MFQGSGTEYLGVPEVEHLGIGTEYLSIPEVKLSTFSLYPVRGGQWVLETGNHLKKN